VKWEFEKRGPSGDRSHRLDRQSLIPRNLFNLEKGANVRSAMVSDEAADTLLATLPEQLGLGLKAQKGPIEFLVIDHAEKVPTAN
jgi:uncharacterized protein (TIGR03435 family)